MSEWRKRLLPASFRGVTFEVESDSSPVGRRTQVHEFVQRDDPVVEDLGRQVRVYKLQAFVIGGDYMAKRDALLAALDEPGPGELAHPWLGRMLVTATECELTHSRQEGGMCRFSLTFVKGSDLQLVASANTAQQLEQASAALWDSGAERYRNAMSGIDAARVKTKQLAGSVTAAFGVIQREFGAVASALRTATGLADMLANTPDALVGLFQASFGQSLGFGSWSDSQRRIASQVASSQALAPAPIGGGADNEAAAAACRDLVRDAVLTQCLAEAVQLPALEPPSRLGAVSLDQQLVVGASDSVPVAEDIEALRDAASDALWQAALVAAPEHFAALQAARWRLRRHLSRVASGGTRLTTLTPMEATPALVLAWRQYGDAARAAELVARNAVRHPGFVPPVPLRIATE